MEAIQSNITTTITSGQNAGVAFSTGGRSPAVLVMPSDFTGSNISFQGSLDGTNYSAVIYAGVAYSVAVAAGQTVVLDPAIFPAFPYLKLVSDVAEGADRSITIRLIMVQPVRGATTTINGAAQVQVMNDILAGNIVARRLAEQMLVEALEVQIHSASSTPDGLGRGFEFR